MHTQRHPGQMLSKSKIGWRCIHRIATQYHQQLDLARGHVLDQGTQRRQLIQWVCVCAAWVCGASRDSGTARVSMVEPLSAMLPSARARAQANPATALG